MKWESKHISLGTVAPKTKHIIKFKAQEVLDIKDIIVSCGCITPKYDVETKELTVSYVTADIPVHLRNIGAYDTHKNVTVKYNNGEQDILSFSVAVRNK